MGRVLHGDCIFLKCVFSEQLRDLTGLVMALVGARIWLCDIPFLLNLYFVGVDIDFHPLCMFRTHVYIDFLVYLVTLYLVESKLRLSYQVTQSRCPTMCHLLICCIPTDSATLHLTPFWTLTSTLTQTANDCRLLSHQCVTWISVDVLVTHKLAVSIGLSIQIVTKVVCHR